MIPTNAIVIRHAADADAGDLRDLAELDSRASLTGPALIAEVDGVLRAALDLDDERVVADPFARTADLVALLRLRARRLAALDTPTRSLRERIAAQIRRPQRTVTARA